MPRTLFTWTPSKLALLERRIVDGDVFELGRIEEAPYLHVRRPSGLSWLLGLSKPEPVLRPPFNTRGEDVHRLMAGTHEGVDEEAYTQVRLGRGTIACLEPREAGDAVVLRDAWSTRGDIACRVVDALQFALVPDAGRPVAVAFAQAPLVIAAPEESSLPELLGTLSDANATALLRPFRTTDAPETPHFFDAITLREGDTIEVLGMVLDARRTRRFDVGQRAASYRESSGAISMVIGDAPGLRMVIRKLG